jgi:hypothetical protein
MLSLWRLWMYLLLSTLVVAHLTLAAGQTSGSTAATGSTTSTF